MLVREIGMGSRAFPEDIGSSDVDPFWSMRHRLSNVLHFPSIFRNGAYADYGHNQFHIRWHREERLFVSALDSYPI